MYDWVVLLLLADGPRLVIASFKSKSFTAGQSLTTFVNMVQGDAFTARYSIHAELETNEAGKFAKFKVKPAGKPSPEDAQYAESVYESIKDSVIAVDADVIDDEAQGEPVPGEHLTDEQIPF